jgi:hypothetical protein
MLPAGSPAFALGSCATSGARELAAPEIVQAIGEIRVYFLFGLQIVLDKPRPEQKYFPLPLRPDILAMHENVFV